MALDSLLLEILACPADKGPLLYFEDEAALYNPRLRRRYRVEDDIPVMLVDEAEDVGDAEHERLLAKAAAQGIGPTFAAGTAADGGAVADTGAGADAGADADGESDTGGGAGAGRGGAGSSEGGFSGESRA